MKPYPCAVNMKELKQNKMRIKNSLFKTSFVLSVIFLVACQKKAAPTHSWVLENSISLEGVNPIGIAALEGQFWLSDGDHNRVVAVNAQGKITDSIVGLERPMHLAAHEGQIWIPQYGADSIVGYNPLSKERLPLSLSDSLDAPAAVAFFENEIAIADFYNHRLLFFNGTDWITIGQEGKKEGDFYYPTDVQITAQNIWVADAYNNRVQVFDKSGTFVKVIGVAQKMNAATGIFVSEDQLFVTDFENHRLLVFYHDGQLAQELTEALEKPIDALINEDRLYVVDYKNSQINVYYYDH